MRRAFGLTLLCDEHRDIGETVTVEDMRYHLVAFRHALLVHRDRLETVWQLVAGPFRFYAATRVTIRAAEPAKIVSAVGG